MELRLNSPVGGLPAKYYWPLCKKKGYDEAKEIVETIIWGCCDIPDLSVPLKKNILKDVDSGSYESMKALTKRYNKAISNVLALEKGTQKFCDRLDKIASRDLLRHIIQQTYSAAVTDAEELNKYQAFSPDVYGETSFDLIAQMLDQIKPTKDDVFVDLGSGVGQVVLQMAATGTCERCVGIERADVPTKYAKEMEAKFKFWMQWYGKKCGEFELIKGDFFDDIHRDKFTDATIIFVNNFAFGPAVDHKLKERFAELKHGTKIVSSKSFCPLNFRISDRNLDDIGTIINVSEIAPTKSSVSWTDKPVSYYLHVIDRTKLEKYFLVKKNGSLHSFSTEDADSCDSYDSRESSEQSLFVDPLPRKRGRTNKLKETDVLSQPRPNIKTKSVEEPHRSTESTNLHGKNSTRPIIRPSKLILNKSQNATEEKPKKTLKRKMQDRSSSPDFDSINWSSQGNIRTYTRKPLPNGFKVENGHYLNYKNIITQENLQRLMDNFKFQYLQMMGEMSDPLYKIKIRKSIEVEIKRHTFLKARIAKVNEEIEDIIVGMQNQIIQATAK
ncbi:histone-lysine N-methyltransferase, H3 lysine-79 specific-like [Sitophilus oryzae]|uniref:Histone-lysine N-methyltransferase, H3 lysine-79 specific n=1 Tax=Sitophilus oryzae TaxID=7048 RepID=A0A6J2Y0A1_SITOR|nr:histone-lysine N-methyltransferase, H3 lysine-79 specific-like [Sitophilus oryzae]